MFESHFAGGCDEDSSRQTNKHSNVSLLKDTL